MLHFKETGNQKCITSKSAVMLLLDWAAIVHSVCHVSLWSNIYGVMQMKIFSVAYILSGLRMNGPCGQLKTNIRAYTRTTRFYLPLKS